MKKLLLILVAGTAAFMGFAIGEEWDFFASAWWGDRAAVTSEQTKASEAAAVGVLPTFFAVLQHAYESGGDPRFLDRLPAAPEVLEEVASDIDYLRRNKRRQTLRLVRYDVAAVKSLGTALVEVRTREYWVVRVLWLADGAEAEPQRGVVYAGKYLFEHQGARWRMRAWDVTEPEAGGVAASGG